MVIHFLQGVAEGSFHDHKSVDCLVGCLATSIAKAASIVPQLDVLKLRFNFGKRGLSDISVHVCKSAFFLRLIGCRYLDNFSLF